MSRLMREPFPVASAGELKPFRFQRRALKEDDVRVQVVGSGGGGGRGGAHLIRTMPRLTCC